MMRASMMSIFEHVVQYPFMFLDLAIWKSGNSIRYFTIPQRTIYLLKKLLLKCMNIISIGWNVLLMENLSRFLTL
jgi:hypothetical protein